MKEQVYMPAWKNKGLKSEISDRNEDKCSFISEKTPNKPNPQNNLQKTPKPKQNHSI